MDTRQASMPECDSRLRVSVKITIFLLLWANRTITPARGDNKLHFVSHLNLGVR